MYRYNGLDIGLHRGTSGPAAGRTDGRRQACSDWRVTIFKNEIHYTHKWKFARSVRLSLLQRRQALSLLWLRIHVSNVYVFLSFPSFPFLSFLFCFLFRSACSHACTENIEKTTITYVDTRPQGPPRTRRGMYSPSRAQFGENNAPFEITAAHKVWHKWNSRRNSIRKGKGAWARTGSLSVSLIFPIKTYKLKKDGKSRFCHFASPCLTCIF